MSSKKKETICILGLIILSFLFFYKAIYFDFLNVDDPFYILDNSYVLNFDLPNLLLKPFVGLYHPVTSLSFAIEWWLGGSRPWLFHLNNVVFHILAALMLFKVCLKLWPKNYLLGFLIALTFLIHPLKAESVAWISERKDVLSGLFLWLTIYLYLVYLDQRKLWLYLLANLTFLFALASKASVVGLPLFLFFLDWYRNGTLDLRTTRSWLHKVPFVAMALTFGIINVVVQSNIRAPLVVGKKNYLDLFYQIQFYLEKAIFPFNLRTWYSPEYLKINILGVASIILISLLTVFIFKKSQSHRKDLLLGWSLFGLSIFPFLKLIPFGNENLVNDRYMYISMTGLTIAFYPFILYYIREMWRNQRRVYSLLFSGFFAVVIGQWLYLMHLQIPHWKDSITLWKYTASLEPTSRKVTGNIGRGLMKARRYEEALKYFEKEQVEIEDFENLAFVLNKLNRGEKAEDIIMKGFKRYPNHSALLNMLGVIRLGAKKDQEALALFTQALQNLKNEISPRLRSLILNHIGLVNMQSGNLEMSEKFFRQALALINNDDTIIYNLGLLLINSNRLVEAKERFMQALKVNPDRAETYNNIGLIFYRENNFTGARVWFGRSLEVDPSFSLARKNLMAMDRERD